jgi:molybdopterin-guanine dinucleotide biosynthesis protein A
MADGRRDMMGLFESLQGRWMECPHANTLRNINRPEELEAAKKEIPF